MEWRTSGVTKGRRIDVNRPIVKYSGSCNILFRVNDGFEFIVTLSSFFVFLLNFRLEWNVIWNIYQYRMQ